MTLVVKVMAAIFSCLVVLLALTTHSNAALFCVCKDGVGQAALQKALDYACGTGADCSDILQNGACYNPNTVKNHCDFAVNSYFQRKGQVSGSCDFSGVATTSSAVPTQYTGCQYQSSPGTSPSTPTTGLGPPGAMGPSSNTDVNAARSIQSNHETLFLLSCCLLLLWV